MGREHRYLKMMSPEEARAALLARFRLPDPPPDEDVATAAAAGRVSATPVFAPRSSPGYHGAAMDGFAVRSADTRAATEVSPLRLRVPDEAVAIDTGDPVPEGFDAVVMIEQVHRPAAGAIEIVRAVAPWQHVRLMGEDVVQTELCLPRGKRISPYDVGALLAAGATRVRVRRRPRVAILPTGDELVSSGAPAPPGAVVEFNGAMLAALIADWGGEPRLCEPARDDPAAIEEAIVRALADADMVAVNAGSSAGRDDHVPHVIARMGDLLAHGVRVMPGKPTALGVVRGKPVVGLPGYPVSAAVAADLFLLPLVCAWLGADVPRRPRVRALLGRKIASKEGLEEIVRVQVGRVGGRYVVTALARGAGVISSLSRASGLIRVPALAEGLEAGAEVDVELLVPREEVDGTLVHVGSHDLAIDVAGDLLRARHPGRALSSANAGSLGGLLAVSRGECHFAGTHLFDPDTGEYNVPYVRRYLPGREMALVHLVRREQGIYVAPGNPLHVRGVADLARAGVRFVNRQRGAGTRVLLDARLAAAGIAADDVRGYDREEHTHMAVAVAVAGGTADAGLGIRAAAAALGLDFVPIEWEPYELCVPAESLDDLAPLLDVIRGDEFRRTAERLGGYDASHSGDVRVVRARE